MQVDRVDIKDIARLAPFARPVAFHVTNISRLDTTATAIVEADCVHLTTNPVCLELPANRWTLYPGTHLVTSNYLSTTVPPKHTLHLRLHKALVNAGCFLGTTQLVEGDRVAIPLHVTANKLVIHGDAPVIDVTAIRRFYMGFLNAD